MRSRSGPARPKISASSSITREYNRRAHGTTHRVPLEHFLEGCHHMRPVPQGLDFESIFLHRVTREVRSDCTVRWDGGFVQAFRGSGTFEGRRLG